jgi:hypothetical protein
MIESIGVEIDRLCRTDGIEILRLKVNWRFFDRKNWESDIKRLETLDFKLKT